MTSPIITITRRNQSSERIFRTKILRLIKIVLTARCQTRIVLKQIHTKTDSPRGPPTFYDAGRLDSSLYGLRVYVRRL